MKGLRQEFSSRVTKGKALKGKWENAISGKQLDSVQKETPVVSATEVIVDKKHKKHNRPLLLQRRRYRLTEENPRKVLAPFWKERTEPLTPCVKISSLSGCKFGDQCLFRHTEADGQPSKKVEDKWWVRISCLYRRRRLPSEEVYSADRWKICSSNHAVKFFKDTSAPRKNSRPSQGVMQKCEPQERSPYAPKV